MWGRRTQPVPRPPRVLRQARRIHGRLLVPAGCRTVIAKAVQLSATAQQRVAIGQWRRDARASAVVIHAQPDDEDDAGPIKALAIGVLWSMPLWALLWLLVIGPTWRAVCG